MSFSPALFGTISQVVGIASSVIGTIAQMQAAQYQAAVAERNRRTAEENAVRELERSQLEQQDWGQEARGQIASLMAQLSAGGMRGDLGSAALQRRDAHSLARRDAERIRQEGTTRATGFAQQAADFAGEAGMARRRAGFALFEGVAGGLSTYLSHAQRNARTRHLLDRRRT